MMHSYNLLSIIFSQTGWYVVKLQFFFGIANFFFGGVSLDVAGGLVNTATPQPPTKKLLPTFHEKKMKNWIQLNTLTS